MENNDSFFDLELDDSFTQKLHDFSSLTDIQETVAALDAQIIAFRDQPRSETWAKAVIGFRREITKEYEAVLKQAKEKMLFLALYHEAEAFLEDLQAQKEAEQKAEEERKIAEAKAEERRKIAEAKAEAKRKFIEEQKRQAEAKAAEERRIAEAKAEEKRKDDLARSIDNEIDALSRICFSEGWEDDVASMRKKVDHLSHDVRSRLERLELLSIMESDIESAQRAHYQKILAQEQKEQRKQEEKRYRLFIIRMLSILFVLCAAAITCLVLGLVRHSPYLIGCAIAIACGTAMQVLEYFLGRAPGYEEGMGSGICLFFAAIAAAVLCFISRTATVYALFLMLGVGVGWIVEGTFADGETQREVAFGLSVLSFLLSAVIFVVALWMIWGFRDFVIKDGVLKDYNGRGETVVTVPDGVTVIGEKAFAKCKKVEMVILPDSVMQIDGYAFKNCENLTVVEYGDGVEYIAPSAFVGTPLDTPKE